MGTVIAAHNPPSLTSFSADICGSRVLSVIVIPLHKGPQTGAAGRAGLLGLAKCDAWSAEGERFELREGVEKDGERLGILGLQNLTCSEELEVPDDLVVIGVAVDDVFVDLTEQHSVVPHGLTHSH